ncbi:MAG: hypothetical protein QM639_09290 [Rhodocyclaceae bacterium]|jgi:hypothetical protein
MATSINPDTFEEVIPHQPRDAYGPSDRSDTGSDVIGTELEGTDTDAEGTGERISVENIPPSQVGHDVEPDVVLEPTAPDQKPADQRPPRERAGT